MFLTTCPYCGTQGELYVVKAWVAAFGKKIRMHSHLKHDGFEVPLKDDNYDLKYDTDDEEVQCDKCDSKMPLGHLGSAEGQLIKVGQAEWDELPLLIGQIDDPLALIILEIRIKDYKVWKSVYQTRGHGLLRKLMDKEEIRIANRLVKIGKLHKGTSDDKQKTVAYFLP